MIVAWRRNGKKKQFESIRTRKRNSRSNEVETISGRCFQQQKAPKRYMLLDSSLLLLYLDCDQKRCADGFHILKRLNDSWEKGFSLESVEFGWYTTSRGGRRNRKIKWSDCVHRRGRIVTDIICLDVIERLLDCAWRMIGNEWRRVFSILLLFMGATLLPFQVSSRMEKKHVRKREK